MPGLRDTLDRFRRAGTPGPAARAGVPVDRGAELSAELGPVLARLADTQDECKQIRRDMTQEADQIRARARDRAATLVADAQRRADAVRAEAAARVRAESRAESARLVSAAHEEAAAVRASAERRMSGYVDRVVALVLETTENGGPPLPQEQQ